MVVSELLMLCLMAALAAVIAMAREDVFFAFFFATTSGFALSWAVREAGEK